MYNVGQVLLHKTTNTAVIFCGVVIDMKTGAKMPEAGVYIFRKDSIGMEVLNNFDDLTYFGELRDIYLGTFIEDMDLWGHYFGVLRKHWMDTPHFKEFALY